MEQAYITDKKFNKIHGKESPLKKGYYENCSFYDCDLSEADLSDFKFADCEFIRCDLSLVKLSMTVFRDTDFKDCKMLGLHFEDCNEFGLSFGFTNCNLSHSSFYKTKIKMTVFKNSLLQEIDFTECELTGSAFDNCDLKGAVFENTNLEKVDFSTSYNYSIDPEKNKLKKAKFSKHGLPGLLDKYDILIVDD